MFEKYILNDNIQIYQLLKNILRNYSRNLKKIKYNYLYKWRINICLKFIKKRNYPKLNHSNSFYVKKSNGFNRLYEDYKYKESHLDSLKVLYQIKEGKNYPFHPKINKGCFSSYNNESFLLNNKVNKFNRRKRNFLQDNYSKSSSVLNCYKNEYNRMTYDFLKNKSINSSNSNLNFPLKSNDKSSINSKSSSSYINLSNSLYSPKNSKKKNYYMNNFSDLNPKISFIKNYPNKNQFPVKIHKGLLEKRINNNINNNIIHLIKNNNTKLNNNNTLMTNNNTTLNNNNTLITNNNSSSNSNKKKSKSNRNYFRYNSFQNLNNLNIKTTRNKERKQLFLNKNESFIKPTTSKKKNYHRNFSNSLIKFEFLNSKNSNLGGSIESYFSKEYIGKNNKNKNSNSTLSKNLSNESTEKFSMACDQITYKAVYQQTTHVTLQTIPDEKILKMCNNYIDTDKSLEKFQRNFNRNYYNNKNNINYMMNNNIK